MPSIKFTPGGCIQFIWTDSLRGLFDQGSGSIERASHVEPDDEGNWVADLSPIGGPKLGPFPMRQEALTAEVQWLEKNIICV
mgnify:CR=1 FL=1